MVGANFSQDIYSKTLDAICTAKGSAIFRSCASVKPHAMLILSGPLCSYVFAHHYNCQFFHFMS